MSFRLTTFLLFFLALLSLALGLVLNRHAGSFNTDAERTVEVVEAKVDTALASAKRQAYTLGGNLMAGHQDFNLLLQSARYPTFIFENAKLKQPGIPEL